MHDHIVRLKIERGSAGGFYITSPDVIGLLVSKMTKAAAVDDIPRALTELFAAQGRLVNVTTPRLENGQLQCQVTLG